MATPHIRESWQDALDVRFSEFWEGYEQVETMLAKLYRMPNHNGRDEMKFTRAGTFPDYTAFSGEVNYSNRFQGYDTTLTFMPFVNGFTVERQLYTDDQFHLFDGEPVEMKKAAYRTREKHGSTLFTNAFSVDTSFSNNSEAVAMCSNSHTTTASGVSTASGFDNLGTAAFSATALAANRIAMKQFRGDQGEQIEVLPDTLLYPTSIYDKVHEVVMSSQKPDTANNDSNVHYEQFNTWEWIYLDTNDTNDWFTLDSRAMKRNQVWVDRDELEFGSINDFETWQLKTRSWMRYSFGWLDWRHVYGNQVA